MRQVSREREKEGERGEGGREGREREREREQVILGVHQLMNMLTFCIRMSLFQGQLGILPVTAAALLYVYIMLWMLYKNGCKVRGHGNIALCLYMCVYHEGTCCGGNYVYHCWTTCIEMLMFNSHGHIDCDNVCTILLRTFGIKNTVQLATIRALFFLSFLLLIPSLYFFLSPPPTSTPLLVPSLSLYPFCHYLDTHPLQSRTCRHKFFLLVGRSVLFLSGWGGGG